LAENLLAAQRNPSWAYYTGPESLLLSEEAVLRAVWILATYGYNGPVTEITSADVLVWDQSIAAVNPNASISVSPSSLNFGDVPVATPEPAIWLLCVAALGVFCWLRKFKPAH
jgi:hypothetical protein